MIEFTIGFILGDFLGAMIMCLCILAKDDEDVR